jgi:N-acyl-D-aspartate/D-glutamate deacylase
VTAVVFGNCGVSLAPAPPGSSCDQIDLMAFVEIKPGTLLALETLVMDQTLDTAVVYGLHGRGVLVKGEKAKVNMIDSRALDLLRQEVTYNLPKGGRRRFQRARGNRHACVAGAAVLRDDELTVQTPGRMIRGRLPGHADRRPFPARQSPIDH